MNTSHIVVGQEGFASAMSLLAPFRPAAFQLLESAEIFGCMAPKNVQTYADIDLTSQKLIHVFAVYLCVQSLN